MGKYQDKFQHRRGQRDGSRGALRGDFNKKYTQGYDAGRFNYERNKYGEGYARVLKAERDFARKGSEKIKQEGAPSLKPKESHWHSGYLGRESSVATPSVIIDKSIGMVLFRGIIGGIVHAFLLGGLIFTITVGVCLILKLNIRFTPIPLFLYLGSCALSFVIGFYRVGIRGKWDLD